MILDRAAWLRCMGVCVAILVSTALVCFSVGAAGPGPVRLIEALTCRGGGGTCTPLTAPEKAILFDVRLPRVLLALVAGGALSAAGVCFQAVLRNPLADPFILGVSGGAAFGAVLCLALGLGSWLGGLMIPALAFVGAAATIAAITSMARIRGTVSVHTLLLAGVVCNAMFSALIMFMTSVANYTSALQIVHWLMGHLGSARTSELAALGLYVLAGLAVLHVVAGDLNLVSLGEESAAQLGVNVERLKLLAFGASSLLVGAVVSIAGVIGFIGLIVPHLLRLVLGPDHRLLLPASTLLGASFLAAADLLARTLFRPVEIPVGVVTAMAGAPFFLYLLRTRQERAAFG